MIIVPSRMALTISEHPAGPLPTITNNDGDDHE